MSTGTPHAPVAPTPAPPDRHRVWLVVLAVVAALSVAFALALAYGVTEQNGADLSGAQGWVLVLLVSLVPGALVATTVWLALRPSARQAPALLVLAPACVLLVMAGVAGMSLLGGRAYDTQQGVIAAACSADEVAALDRLAGYGPDFNGAQGSADGTCSAYWVFPGEDGRAAMATIGGALAADGWVTNDSAWDVKTFAKDGQSVRVVHVRSSEGTTAISVSVVTPG